ncbi:hypothetical protein AAF712_014872 [Marasmius tenuissimus]|uniref:Uncharacterized protein n=1 Tax=Marasmius tenuissimus TaxID=585030 RepID=A0ABR2ZC26_9AGAR
MEAINGSEDVADQLRQPVQSSARSTGCAVRACQHDQGLKLKGDQRSNVEPRHMASTSDGTGGVVDDDSMEIDGVHDQGEHARSSDPILDDRSPYNFGPLPAGRKECDHRSEITSNPPFGTTRSTSLDRLRQVVADAEMIRTLRQVSRQMKELRENQINICHASERAENKLDRLELQLGVYHLILAIILALVAVLYLLAMLFLVIVVLGFFPSHFPLIASLRA